MGIAKIEMCGHVQSQREGKSHEQRTTVGIDLAKNAFSLHGVDFIKPRGFAPDGTAREQLLTLIAQFPACLVGMEACSGARVGAAVSGTRPYRATDGAEVP